MNHSIRTESPRWEKLAIGAGIGYSLLLVAATVLFPMPPDSGVIGSHPHWLAGHETAVLIQVIIRSVAATCFVGAAGYDGTALEAAGFVALPLSLLWHIAASVVLLRSDRASREQESLVSAEAA